MANKDNKIKKNHWKHRYSEWIISFLEKHQRAICVIVMIVVVALMLWSSRVW